MQITSDMKMRAAAAPARTVSAGFAAGLVKSGMWLDYYITINQPDRFDAALGPRLSHDDLAILGCAKSIFEWHARHRLGRAFPN